MQAKRAILWEKWYSTAVFLHKITNNLVYVPYFLTVRFLRFLSLVPYISPTYKRPRKNQRRARELPKNSQTQKVLFIKIWHFSFAQFKNKLYLCSAKLSDWLCRHIIKAFISACFGTTKSSKFTTSKQEAINAPWCVSFAVPTTMNISAWALLFILGQRFC